MSGSITSSASSGGGNFIGSGSDTITLLMSGDSFGPSGADGAAPQFTLNVDGQQIGGLQSVSASHSSGQTQTFNFGGNFEPGRHDVTITFANNSGTQGDQTNFGRGGDRNLYIDSLRYNGNTVSNGTTPVYESPLYPPNGPYTAGNAVFTVNDTTAIPQGAPSTPSTTPGPINVGSGADRVTLRVSEDPFQGDAQFTVSVDGKQVGGTLTTTAVAWQGQQQVVNLYGDWGPGAHTVTVTYISDKIGVTDGQGNALDNQDQNLYVNAVSYDGIEAGGAPWELSNNGSFSFQIPAGGQAGAFTSNAAVETGAQVATDNKTTVATEDKAASASSSKDAVSSGSKDAASTESKAAVTSDKVAAASTNKDVAASGKDATPTAGKDAAPTESKAAVTSDKVAAASTNKDVAASGKDAAPAAGKDAAPTENKDAAVTGNKKTVAGGDKSTTGTSSDDNAAITPAVLTDTKTSKDGMSLLKSPDSASSSKDAAEVPTLSLKDWISKDTSVPGSSFDWAAWKSSHSPAAQDPSTSGGMGSWWSQQGSSHDGMFAYHG